MTAIFILVKVITILSVKMIEKIIEILFVKISVFFITKNIGSWINCLILTNTKSIQNLQIFLLFLSFIFDNFILLYYL